MKGLNEINGFNKKKNNKKRRDLNHVNKKSMILVGIIIGVIVVFTIIIKVIGGEFNFGVEKADIAKIIKNKETSIVYVGSDNSKKCAKCKDIVNYLNKEKINYVSYIVDDYSEKEYKSMLTSLNINPSDFGYPAVMYIKEGALYSNVININDISSLKVYVKDYDLKNVNPVETKK